MTSGRLPWQEELAIIDRTMRAISGVTDPEELVNAYWQGISPLLPARDHLAVSRRGVEPPYYLVTRSSRFKEDLNPWTQRDRLPKLSGGIVGEIAYANRPVVIEDLPARLSPDDPAYFYLEGFQALVAVPQYDGGEGLNVLMALFRPGVEFDHSIIPMLHWQSGLFGRGTQNLVLRNQLSAWRSSTASCRPSARSSVRCCHRRCRRSPASSWRRITRPAPAPAATTTTSSHSPAGGGGCSSPTSPATARPRPCLWPSPTRSRTPSRARTRRRPRCSPTSTRSSRARTRATARSSPRSTRSSTRRSVRSATPAPATTRRASSAAAA